MVLEPVLCPDCSSNNVVKHGQSGEGKQRYKGRNLECRCSTFFATMPTEDIYQR